MLLCSAFWYDVHDTVHGRVCPHGAARFEAVKVMHILVLIALDSNSCYIPSRLDGDRLPSSHRHVAIHVTSVFEGLLAVRLLFRVANRKAAARTQL